MLHTHIVILRLLLLASAVCSLHSFCTLSAPVAHRARVHALVGVYECSPVHIPLCSLRHRSRSCLRCSTTLASLSAHQSFCTFLHLHRIISTLSAVCFLCVASTNKREGAGCPSALPIRGSIPRSPRPEQDVKLLSLQACSPSLPPYPRMLLACPRTCAHMY